jgi:hypothetical protein
MERLMKVKEGVEILEVASNVYFLTLTFLKLVSLMTG